MLLVTVSVLRVCLPVKATYFSYVVVVVVVGVVGVVVAAAALSTITYQNHYSFVFIVSHHCLL